jgi:hypothetical protein
VLIVIQLRADGEEEDEADGAEAEDNPALKRFGKRSGVSPFTLFVADVREKIMAGMFWCKAPCMGACLAVVSVGVRYMLIGRECLWYGFARG